jgi:hypothetical protein
VDVGYSALQRLSAGYDSNHSLIRYEKQIAARSLNELEGFYRMLMEPYGSYEEKQKLCPPWNQGGKSCYKFTDVNTLHRGRGGQGRGSTWRVRAGMIGL